MSQSTGASKKKAKKKGDNHATEQFNVQRFVVKERELEHSMFDLDQEMKHSQIRTVNAIRNVNLMQTLCNSLPTMLDLTAVPDQGMFPVLWQWCMCMPFHCMCMHGEWIGLDWNRNESACLLPGRSCAVTWLRLMPALFFPCRQQCGVHPVSAPSICSRQCSAGGAGEEGDASAQGMSPFHLLLSELRCVWKGFMTNQMQGTRSHVMVWQFFFCPSFPSQLPRQITWGNSEHQHMMPTELAGWQAESVHADNGTWVPILSRQSKLATELVMRGPLCLNVVVDLKHLGIHAIETVKGMVPEVATQVKLAARLHKIQRGGHPA